MNRIEEAIQKAKLARAREREAQGADDAEVRPRPRPAGAERVARHAFGSSHGPASYDSSSFDDAVPLPPPTAHVTAPRDVPTLTMDEGALHRAGLWPDAENSRRLADEFRIAKRSVLSRFTRSRGASGLRRVVAVSSALAGEGKSFSSFHLAMSFALERESAVLLIDGDAPRPSLTEAMGCSGRPGLLNCLEGTATLDEALYRTNVPGLWFLPAGQSAHAAAELMSSPQTGPLLDAATARLGNVVIVVDTSPLLLTVEARALVDVADQTLLVVKANSTPQGAILQALDEIGEGRTVQLLLNRRVASKLDAYQYYYASYGTSYGAGNGTSGPGKGTGAHSTPSHAAALD